MGVEGGAIHQQRLQLWQVAAGARQHVQAPGVDIAPVGHLAPLQPGRGQPGEVEPRAQDGDAVGQGHEGLQQVQAALVLHQQDALRGQRCVDQLAGGHALAGKGEQAGGQRREQEPMLVVGAGVQKGDQTLAAGLAVKTHIEQGREQGGVALEELAVVARHGQRAQRAALGAAGRQLQRHAGGGGHVVDRHAAPQCQAAQQQAVKERIHPR